MHDILNALINKILKETDNDPRRLCLQENNNYLKIWGVTLVSPIKQKNIYLKRDNFQFLLLLH